MRRFFVFTLLLLAVLPGLGGQNVSDLIISEALACPDSTGILDDYGRCGGWIELYNTSTGTVNVGGCFFTDDRNEPRKSPIPKHDKRTAIGPRQVMLFYASGNGADGTFYTRLTLRPGSTLYLVSNDGRTVIDSLVLPATLGAGQSVSKFPVDAKGLVFQAADEATAPSPRVVNGSQETSSKAQEMAEKDPHGSTLSLVSVSVVFLALAILWLLFWLFFERPAQRKAKPRTSSVIPSAAKEAPSPEVAAAIAMALERTQGGDLYAAIATALHLYLSESVHDAESFVLTIRRRSSAWTEARPFRRKP